MEGMHITNQLAYHHSGELCEIVFKKENKGSLLLFKYKIKPKVSKKDSNNSYTEDQGRNTIKLPKTAYYFFS